MKARLESVGELSGHGHEHVPSRSRPFPGHEHVFNHDHVFSPITNRFSITLVSSLHANSLRRKIYPVDRRVVCTHPFPFLAR
jgi:hypothetical protein